MENHGLKHILDIFVHIRFCQLLSYTKIFMHALTQSKQLVFAFICFCIHVCVPKQPRNLDSGGKYPQINYYFCPNEEEGVVL